MALFPLDIENAKGHYDEDQKILIVAYSGTLAPAVTAEMYVWLAKLAAENPHLLHEAKGAVFDFRQVTKFTKSNLLTMRRESGVANAQFDMGHVPVALIASDLRQEQQLYLTLRFSSEESRKRVVNSMEEAKSFFEKFRAGMGIVE
jgi:hypothetical protein